MRKVASIGIFIGALAVAVLPARADDHIIGFAAGQLRPASSICVLATRRCPAISAGSAGEQ
jgi:hypothetical protein